jgi:PNKP adenylyltransferase domain, ligase domain
MLDLKIKNRIEWFCKNQINDFSPTISPAPKNKENNEIESIQEAVDYFLKNNVSELVVQKKYMGSYCTIYLKRNLDESYFVSRNGHKIEHIDLEEAKESVADLHKKMLKQFPDFEIILIASELLPWKILGSGLIDREFNAYYDAQKTHNEYLETHNLYDKIEKVKASSEFLTFEEDKRNLSSKEFRSKHKSHIIRQYEALGKIKILDLEKQEKSLSIYKTQIDTFGKDEKIHFKPFNILKIVSNDGNETIPNSNLTYELLNEDTFLHLKFNSENKTENIQKIESFYQNLTSNNEEGIMIKPDKSYIQGLVPCFKVRNNNYLTMIYGINFQIDFDYYLDKRKIAQKMEQSINGWEINQQMLQIPYKNIDEENYLMKILLLKRINDEEVEKTLDPRL